MHAPKPLAVDYDAQSIEYEFLTQLTPLMPCIGLSSAPFAAVGACLARIHQAPLSAGGRNEAPGAVHPLKPMMGAMENAEYLQHHLPTGFFHGVRSCSVPLRDPVSILAELGEVAPG